jgi:hypothetical protein
MLGISTFLYAKGWMSNFKTRYNLSKFKIVGESASISAERVNAARERSAFRYYRKALVRHCLKTIEEKESIIMPTVKEALILIKNSWKKVKNHFCLIFYLFLYIYMRA